MTRQTATPRTPTQWNAKAKGKLMLALLLAVSITAACTSNNSPNTNNSTNTNNPSENNQLADPDSGEPDASNSGDGGTDNVTEPAEPDTGEAAQPDAAEPAPGEPLTGPNGEQILPGEGVFNGLIDGHTIEIQTSEGPMAFQHDESLNEAVSALERGDEVTFNYYVVVYQLADGTEGAQPWVSAIEEKS